MGSSNVRGFVSTVPTLYEEEEDYALLYGYSLIINANSLSKQFRAFKFLNFINF